MRDFSSLSFSEWRQLAQRDPHAAAHEVHVRIASRLSPAQQRAAIAWLPDEEQLTAKFAAADFAAPLGGIPYFVKDLYDVAGIPTFAGSTFLPEVRPTPTRDSAIVSAFARAGAVCAGKTQMHEFAYGITGENPHYGDCEHPRFPGRTTAGSSSGSAAAVAAGIVPLALGSDTGGSVRVPAAFCGLFGFRLAPQETLIADAFPLARSFDAAGWFTANALDLLTVNSTVVGLRTANRELRGCYLELGRLDPDVDLACRTAAEKFAPLADSATAGQLRNAFSGTVETYNAVVAQEAWATHAPWAEKYRDRYDPAVAQRLDRARELTSDARESAAAHRLALQLTWTSFFLTYDFLILPATPCAALTKADCTLENRLRILELTAPASIGRLPVLTIPVPLPSGLSAGLQIIVNHAQSPVIAWTLQQI